jgi:hypothetical protein
MRGADDVFKALADPSRGQVLDLLCAKNGQTLGALCEQLDMRRQSRVNISIPSSALGLSGRCGARDLRTLGKEIRAQRLRLLPRTSRPMGRGWG